jgi:hypothetical protein
MINDRSLQGGLPVTNIAVADLTPTQDMEQTGVNPMSTTAPIFVVARGGKNYVIDGHHRMKRALANDIPEIPARVYMGSLHLNDAARVLGVDRRDILEAMHWQDREKYMAEAKRDFKKGDHVFFGKYKNKRGKIVDTYVDDKDHPAITIEPTPKGRKKDVEMGLYKVWPDEDPPEDE